MSDYLQQIKSIADSLSAIGDPVSYKEHVDIVLEGLPSEYETLVSLCSMNSKFQSLSIQEIGALLLAQEARIEKNKCSAATEFTVNTATAGKQVPQTLPTETNAANHQHPQSVPQNQWQEGNYAGDRGNNGGRGRGGGGRGRGRNSV